jgi:hypothetical protein
VFLLGVAITVVLGASAAVARSRWPPHPTMSPRRVSG